jgi:hypothetical protein
MSNTIEQLEGQIWGEPEYDSHVVTNSHRLRKKPIDQFSVEDLRFMIGQNIGTRYLMPRALGLLEQNPVVEDYHYPGELLQSVLHLQEQYWRGHPAHLARALKVAESALRKLEEKWAERKAEARQLYGAELDGKQYPEDEVEEWCNIFIRRHHAD